MAIDKIIKIGLTGGIGSGKSTVSDILKKEGITVIDADKISREVLEVYPNISEDIKKQFGEDFFDDGKLNRRKLGNYVFKNKLAKEQLEGIIIPYIKSEIFNGIEECSKKGESMCVIDAPTLIENKLHESMDINILVWVDKDTQIQRVKKRDQLSSEQVMDRISSQMPLDEKKEFVDYIIDNSGSIEETSKRVKDILNSIK